MLPISRAPAWLTLAVALGLLLVGASECQRFSKRSIVAASNPKFSLANLGQRIQQQSSPNALEEQQAAYGGPVDEAPAAAGEQVDRLASASGDLYWPNSPPIADWWQQQQQLARLLRLGEGGEFGAYPNGVQAYQPAFGDSLPESSQSGGGGQLQAASPRLSGFGRAHEKRQHSYQPAEQQQQQLAALMDPSTAFSSSSGSGLRNYHALINDFKSNWAPLANPSREGRGFKPKLMSTARGFGKRSDPSSARHISYADLLASASPNGPLAINGKMSANAIR